MLRKDAGMPIQGMPLGRGDATSPYEVLDSDSVVEFNEDGVVTCHLNDGRVTQTTVLMGGRYAISSDVIQIKFSGIFNVS